MPVLQITTNVTIDNADALAKQASSHENGKLQPLDVKAGDQIVFNKWSGTEITVDGEELLVMKESDIMGVVTGAKAKKAA